VSVETEIVNNYRTLAVVGLSSDETRESYRVTKYMQDRGYRIIPVNPLETEVLGEKAYPDLTSIPEPPEVVVVFRRSEFVPEIVAQAIAVGAKAVWLQEGIAHGEAAERAMTAGLQVVQSRCIRTVHRRIALSA